MQVTKTSMLTGKTTTKSLPITMQQLRAFYSGKLVQDVFPDLSPEDREWLRSGITEEEWKEHFGDNISFQTPPMTKEQRDENMKAFGNARKDDKKKASD